MSLSMRRLRLRGSNTHATASPSTSIGPEPPRCTASVYGAVPAYEPMFVGTDSLGRKMSFSPRAPAQESGEEALLGFIRANLGSKAQSYAIRFMNRTPLKADRHYTYIVQQGTEEADLRAIEKDLTSGRLYRNGLVLQGGAWSRMLLGPRFALGSSKKQVHELTYRRSRCTCLGCIVRRALDRMQAEAERAAEAAAVEADVAAEEAVAAAAAAAAAVAVAEAPVSPVSFRSSTSSDTSKEKSSRGSYCNFEDAERLGALSRTSTSDEEERADDPHDPFNVFSDVRAMSMPVLRKETRMSSTMGPTRQEFLPDFPSGSLALHAIRRQSEFVGSPPISRRPHYYPPPGISSIGIPPSLEKQVQRIQMPTVGDLQKCPGTKVFQGDLLIGDLQRINSRSAKIKFEEDVKGMFGDAAYAGPSTTAQLYSKVLTVAQDYYKLRRGKKNRRLYIRGYVVQIPIEVGVVKVPRQPLYMSEFGSGYLLHARQTYVWKLLLL